MQIYPQYVIKSIKQNPEKEDMPIAGFSRLTLPIEDNSEDNFSYVHYLFHDCENYNLFFITADDIVYTLSDANHIMQIDKHSAKDLGPGAFEVDIFKTESGQIEIEVFIFLQNQLSAN